MQIKTQRGQALVLIALAFIGLAAFVGLAVDGGILFTNIGHLRRAVDAAALAAAGQFREGRSNAQLTASAKELINLNNLDPSVVIVDTCATDFTLCPPPGQPPRKFVRVTAFLPINFTFLPIVGWRSVTITANAVSETASIDLVLAIDTSDSMTYDAACDNTTDDDAWAETHLPGGLGHPDGDPNDGCGGNPQIGGFADDYMRNPDNCNDPDPAPGIQGQCHPFEEVRAAALALVGRMYFPYDRLAVVSFDQNAVVKLNLKMNGCSDMTSCRTEAASAIGNLTVYKFPGCAGWPDPTDCTSTDIADGMLGAGNQFGLFKREEAVWIVILLTDGAANTAVDSHAHRICPGTAGHPDWVEPLCRCGDGCGRFCRMPGFELRPAGRLRRSGAGRPGGCYFHHWPRQRRD
jgi:Flp pilus assembly protein TadG